MAASTLNTADRSAGGTSGFHSRRPACSKTLSSAVSLSGLMAGRCWPRRILSFCFSWAAMAASACFCCWSYWEMSRARSAAGSVGMAANWAWVGESCRATGSSAGTPAPFWKVHTSPVRLSITLVRW